MFYQELPGNRFSETKPLKNNNKNPCTYFKLPFKCGDKYV